MIQLLHQLFPVFKIAPGKDNHKFISAKAENRTVLEHVADECAGVFDILIPGQMALGVVDHFQVVDIADNNCKLQRFLLLNCLIQLVFPLLKSTFVFNTGQRIFQGHVLHNIKFFFLLFLRQDGCL